MGGMSSEKEISTKTGTAILNALLKKGYTAVSIDATSNVADILQKNHIEVAFIALHGSPGEDGTIVLYGEGTGYKIQKGCKYFGGEKKVEFILFDIKIGRWWLRSKDVREIGNKLSLFSAPYVMTGDLDTLIQVVSKGLKSKFGDFYAEGLVAIPYLELFDRAGRRIITKIKHKDFFKP